LVNATHFRSRCAVLLLATLVLTAAAWLRSGEYDEQYTLFLTAGTPRPDWPATAFPAGMVATLQSGHATLAGIARDLRATDVHPPLYFWAAALWRRLFGPSLFALRLLSVLCGVVSIALIGSIARRCAIRPQTAMLLGLGCYAFVYTNAIARGFAPAQMLTLFGVNLLLGRRPLLAGACLGAACCCNYLAVFVATAVIATTGAWLAIPAALPFLALDAWFFAAQHGARAGQFVPFELWPSLVRLAEYQAAAVFGGLPLYLDGAWQVAAKAGIGVTAAALAIFVVRTRPWRTARPWFIAALAPPVGLLLLGAAFNTTPIELRYLSFGVPFLALLIAESLPPRPVLLLLFAIQGAGIAGLLFAPGTMQPARAAATAAARFAGDAIVLLPAGNDGVGIVGAFAIEAPATLPILPMHPADTIPDRYHRVALALLPQDRDSIATIAALRATLSLPNWRRVAVGPNLEVYQRGE
jgi:Dolichyl-phosphate-mannose-protein mannosyltransferase